MSLRACLLALVASAGASSSNGGHPSSAQVTIDASKTFQEYDGMGFSQAFQRATHIHGTRAISPLNETLSPKNSSLVLDLLFTEKGANFNILRNGIGASLTDTYDLMLSIIPVDPGSPNAKPHYVFNHDDGSQVWLSKEAKKRQPNLLIYADAWSAPGFMKDNGTENFGGHLCGVTGTHCKTGDWRQAYANMLVQYIRFYAEEGIKIDYLGFLNEPDLATSYASMQSDGTQAADFLEVLYPTLKKSPFKTKICCCDTAGWEEMRPRLAEIQDRNLEYTVDIVTSHGYDSPPSTPFDTTHKVWQTEWAELNLPWSPVWDNVSAPFEGLVWAQNVQDAFVKSNVSAFLNWIGSEYTTGNSPLILNYGDSVEISKRFWAYAHFSKFVRPGARRIDAESSSDDLHVSAFRNPDGTAAIQVINVGNGTEVVAFKTSHARGPSIKSYLTNNQYDLKESTVKYSGRGSFSGSVPARSMVSFVMR
ncbi:putative endo-1,6-beta-D-glucanase BGN16.3 precursor [Rhizodiscina lignyota]|uniref:Endo-1,6-beta-D-glucanase BGN16.3 n=1 Tax=Rhizodiscina lignyota TaxID=1504668 RepID=A0A9P4M5B3_9PEZI|nr:putative endo-1,6-beta-D-glucanase BGN16.3 precursor [Rhizodiscina lignyota]